MNWLLAFFFGCFHDRTTWPITIKGRTYVACLACGEEIPYNWDTMKYGSRSEQGGGIADAAWETRK